MENKEYNVTYTVTRTRVFQVPDPKYIQSVLGDDVTIISIEEAK